MAGAKLDATAEFLQHAPKVGSLDPRRELGGDLRQRAVVVEVKLERFVVAGDDLGREVLRRTMGPGVVTIACSMTCSSSRTLPGQS